MIANTCSKRRRESGFTLIELLIVVAIIGLISAIVIPSLQRAVTRSVKTALAADGNAVYSAFTRYYSDNGFFPSTSSPTTRAFSLSTMFPLSNGYVTVPSAITTKLQNDRFTAYDSPNLSGSDTQFYVVMTSKRDPSIVLLVANTDQYPGYTGTWYDGVYFIQGSSIVPLKTAL